MSFAVTAIAAVAVSSLVSIYNGQQQKKAQDKALSQAEAQAKAQEEANNRANAKRPDTQSILDAAMQAGKGGASSTMLTGASGVGNDQLTLGKSTLLGQ